MRTTQAFCKTIETNGGKYLKKDFFVHKNMKRKFLEILFYLRARRKNFSRETSSSLMERRNIHDSSELRPKKSVLWSLWKTSIVGHWKQNPSYGLSVEIIFSLKLWMKNSRSMELNRVTPIALHGEKEKLADLTFYEAWGKKLTSPEKILADAILQYCEQEKKSDPNYARKFIVVRIYHC